MNSTFRSSTRDESRPRYGEPFESPISERRIEREINELCAAAKVIHRDSERESRPALSTPQCSLQPSTGHAVPTRRELSVRRVK